MEMAGTPCPYMGKVGKEASVQWQQNKRDRTDYKEHRSKFVSKCRGTRGEKGMRKSKITCVKEFNNN